MTLDLVGKILAYILVAIVVLGFLFVAYMLLHDFIRLRQNHLCSMCGESYHPDLRFHTYDPVHPLSYKNCPRCTYRPTEDEMWNDYYKKKGY